MRGSTVDGYLSCKPDYDLHKFEPAVICFEYITELRRQHKFNFTQQRYHSDETKKEGKRKEEKNGKEINQRRGKLLRNKHKERILIKILIN
jgi:hypothetical protein